MGYKTIGNIKNKYNDQKNNKKPNNNIKSINLDKEYANDLKEIEKNDLLKIILHLPESNNRGSEEKTSSSSRSQRKPNPIKSCLVKLVEREKNILKVKGLEAIEKALVLDIEPYSKKLDPIGKNRKNSLKANPRKEINKLVDKQRSEELLIKAGELHGHFCPFLSLGVKAGIYALNKLETYSDGMEEIIAITEINNCLSDGVQYVTGCTFGNNSLIYRDFGKTAVTFAKRDGAGIRLKLRDDFNLIEKEYPEASKLFDKVIKNRGGSDQEKERLNELWTEVAFDFINRSAEEFFEVNEVNPDIPDYAPIFEDEFCEECGEKVISAKIVEEDDKKLCVSCSSREFMELNGRGLVFN